MFFDQLLAKFRTNSAKRIGNKRAGAQQGEPRSKSLTEQPYLQPNENFNTKRKLNTAFSDIEKAIQSEGPSNELLLKKAELLLRKGKFHQARRILNELSRSKNDSKASNSAKKLLKLSQQLQQKTSANKTNNLCENLHETARKYHQKLLDLPQADNQCNDFELTQQIRKEARRARTKELPKLSCELIELTLEAGHESPWLLHDKAISLSMMGQRKKALSLLEELKKDRTGEKLTKSIQKNIDEIKKNSKQNQLKSKACLAKQSVLAAKAKKLDFQLPEKINERTNIKALVFKQARACLGDNPQACLSLVDSILDYFPGDLASLQLKGEALAELKQNDEAIQIWKELTHSKTEKIAKKARSLISLVLTQEAGPVSANRPPKAVISSLIEQHLKYKLTPELNKEISEILLKIEPINSDSLVPELRQHQLQLLLNTLTIEFLETHLREQGRLNPAAAAAQKPGTIRKTGPKAG